MTDPDILGRSGLSQDDLSVIVGVVRTELESHQHPKLWLFGSRARGTQHKHSDIDLLLSESDSLSQAQVSAIQEKFEESDLPFKVDFILEKDLYETYRDTFLAERIRLHQF